MRGSEAMRALLLRALARYKPGDLAPRPTVLSSCPGCGELTLGQHPSVECGREHRLEHQLVWVVPAVEAVRRLVQVRGARRRTAEGVRAFDPAAMGIEVEAEDPSRTLCPRCGAFGLEGQDHGPCPGHHRRLVGVLRVAVRRGPAYEIEGEPPLGWPWVLRSRWRTSFVQWVEPAPAPGEAVDARGSGGDHDGAN